MLSVDGVVEAERKQFAKLLALEHKELRNQKQMSDAWIKYIYLLLNITMDQCKRNDILFSDLDEFQQTLLLRSSANELRAMCNIPAYSAIYDPLDAAQIVARQSTQPMGKQFRLNDPAEEVAQRLHTSFSGPLKSVAVSFAL